MLGRQRGRRPGRPLVRGEGDPAGERPGSAGARSTSCPRGEHGNDGGMAAGSTDRPPPERRSASSPVATSTRTGGGWPVAVARTRSTSAPSSMRRSGPSSGRPSAGSTPACPRRPRFLWSKFRPPRPPPSPAANPLEATEQRSGASLSAPGSITSVHAGRWRCPGCPTVPTRPVTDWGRSSSRPGRSGCLLGPCN